MNWEGSADIPKLPAKSVLVVYGTNSLVLPGPFSEVLTDDEIIYSKRLKEEARKKTWLTCRASLRLILASNLAKKPLDIKFQKGRFGKLFLRGTNIFFNVSHTESAFLLGFSFAGRIGVDIESLNRPEELQTMVNYAFSEAEARYCNNGQNKARFVETWTTKEAFLKAAGVGLVDHLTSITVTGNRHNDILRYGLKRHSFLCPNGEMGSVVFRKGKAIFFTLLR